MPNHLPLTVLHADSRFAVCIKPVGVEAEKQLPAMLEEQIGNTFYPVHRLDLNVGGVMVYAADRQAAAILSQAVQQGTMVKEYVAVVHGIPPESGDWQDLLWKDSKKNKVFVVKRQRAGVKPARLTFERLSAGEPSAVRIRLYTGRSHQIRVQFASRGFPLVGDHKYGAHDKNAAPMLFSCSISFPFEGDNYRFEAMPDWLPFHKE